MRWKMIGETFCVVLVAGTFFLFSLKTHEDYSINLAQTYHEHEQPMLNSPILFYDTWLAINSSGTASVVSGSGNVGHIGRRLIGY